MRPVHIGLGVQVQGVEGLEFEVVVSGFRTQCFDVRGVCESKDRFQHPKALPPESNQAQSKL